MRTGLSTRGILCNLISLFAVAVCFSQSLQVINLNENQIIPAPYHYQPHIDQDLMQHEILGIEFRSYYKNTTTDQHYIACLELDKYTKIPLPSYVEGWVDKADTLAPGEDITFRTVVFIRPTLSSPVGLDSFIVHSYMRFGLSPTDGMRSESAKIRINVIRLAFSIPVIVKEPLYNRGTDNTIFWNPAQGSLYQEAYCFDVEDRENLINSVKRLYRVGLADTEQTYFEDLKDGHRYGYFVKSAQNTPRGETYLYSDIDYSTQDNSPPQPVVHPQALLRQNNTILLSWNAVSDELSGIGSFRIYRGIDTGAEEFVAEVNYTGANLYSWRDTAPISGMTNYYRVRSVDCVGNEGDGERSNGIDINGTGNYIPPDGYSEEDTASSHSIYSFYRRGAVDTLWIKLDGRENNIRFEAVRDSLSFFESPPGTGSRYFDSGWLVPDSLKKHPAHSDSAFYVFDYSESKGIFIDANFVNGHSYFRRVSKQYFAITDTISLGKVVPDCFPPVDTYNVKAVAVMDDPDFQFSLSGYTRWHLELSWQPVMDDVSGLKRYHVYRKVEGKDTTFEEVFLPEYFQNTSAKDSLDVTDYGQLFNPLVTYSVVGEDRVGNVRNPNESDWKIQERALGAPRLAIGDTSSAIAYPSHSVEADTVFTNQHYITLRIAHFDISEVIDYVVFINDVQVSGYHFDQDLLVVPLPDVEISQIQIRALYDGKRSSTWSRPIYVIRTQNRPPENLVVWNDTTSWEGHHYLRWIKPSLDAVGYEVWRWNENGDSCLVGMVSSRENVIHWIDYYDHSELSGEADDVLVNYEMYRYKVLKVDMFNEKTGFSNQDSAYCNHPPVIITDELKQNDEENVIIIHWERIEPTIASGSWLTKVKVSRDRLENIIYQTDDITHVVDDTLYMYDRDVQLGHNYIFQIKEIPEFPTGRTSSWSKPYTVNLASLDSLFVQPQPGGSIFLSWEEDILIDRLPVDRFELCRMTDGDTLCLSIPSTQTSYMDTDHHLVHGQRYLYRVSALNNLEQILAVNEKEAVCDTGKVFIPAVIPFYYGYFHSDSLEVFWEWRDIVGNPLESTTNGATSLLVQISVSEAFPPDEAITTTSEWLCADPVNRSMKIQIPTVISSGNEILYCRITAKDRWGHPESAVYSKIETVVFDPVPPKPVKDFTLSSVQSYNVGSDSVCVQLEWTGEGVEWPENEDVYWSQLIGNVAAYRIVHVFSLNDTVEVEYQPIHSDHNQHEDSYLFLDKIRNIEHHWGIAAVDSAGNESAFTWIEPDSFLTTPKPPDPDDFKSCVFQPVESSTGHIEYFIEIAMDRDHFQWAYDSTLSGLADHILSQSGWITSTVYKDTSGWGSIEVDTTWFRIKVRRNMNWESGWSFLAFYTEDDGHSPGKITDVDDVEKVPTVFKITQNVPNPFNAETAFLYQLPEPGHVTIRLYNIRGALVRTLQSEDQIEGFYSVVWDGKDDFGRRTASGIYLVRVFVETERGNVFQEQMKIMMIK